MKSLILTHVFMALLWLGACSLPAEEVASRQEETLSLKDVSEFSPVSLRGFGKVSGTAEMLAPGVSLLKITCQDTAHAALLQAKYLSDLETVLPLKSSVVNFPGGAWEIHQRRGSGAVVALLKDKQVFLIAATDEHQLQTVAPHCELLPKSLESSRHSTDVPMYLNRWDQFGFRFYYRPFELPKGEKKSTYDPCTEFDFARDAGQSGVVFWDNMDDNDTSEGMTSEPWWSWAFDEAIKRNLPVGINIMMGIRGGSWFYNRFREETMQKMPQFCGNFYRTADNSLGANGVLSWNSQAGVDAQLKMLQDTLARRAGDPHVVSVLEPHGELRHGEHDVFLEYGPVADKGYRKFLSEKYRSLDALNRAWGTSYANWNEAHVPELASFLGWGPQALDLSGTWRIGYEALAGENADAVKLGSHDFSQYLQKIIPTKGAPPEWYAENFDDSGWPQIVAPGNDRTMFLEQRPAVYRQTFDLPAEWPGLKGRVWLYLWDLNTGAGDKVMVSLNGQSVGESSVQITPHWGAFEVAKFLRPGKNQLSIRLPKGILAYRIYLSPGAPKQFPDLGRERNAQWADFSDWIAWSRVESVRRGMEMIRQVVPDKQITLMAPGPYADGIRQLARTYGGNFHNTGYMGSFWADDLPAIMRGAGLPFDLEPGSPAKDLADFKKQIGRYMTEGIQGIDYYIHIGSVFWDSGIRAYFQDNLPIIKLTGKYHAPKADVAALYSTKENLLAGYPWGNDPNTNLGAGYWKWNVRANLRGIFETDALTDSSFADGDASRYRVIFDTNTSLLSEERLAEIEKFVREGGTFVTFVQTGRHSLSGRDTWPIARLSGYRVTRIDPHDTTGEALAWHHLKAAPGQDVFPGDWDQVRANGLSLQSESPDTRDLMLWEDGSVAIGSRPLGKGMIIQVGCKFTGKGIPDRLEPHQSSQKTALESSAAASNNLTRLLVQILQWRGVAPIASRLEPENDNVILRHYVSNNGLYDIWMLWNQSDLQTVSGHLFPGEEKNPPAWVVDVRTGSQQQGSEKGIPVELPPLGIQAFVTPRNPVERAPSDWFRLQRDWWRGGAPEKAKPLPEFPARFSVNLQRDWAFKTLAPGENVADLVGSTVEDSTWERRDLGIWTGHSGESRHVLLRKKIMVPAAWKKGDVSLWIQSWVPPTFFDSASVWLNGKKSAEANSVGLKNLNPEGMLQPGREVTLAVEIEGSGALMGCRGAAWLWYWPKPESRIDLSGDWVLSDNMLVDHGSTKLPGAYHAYSLRKKVQLPAESSGKNAVLDVEGDGQLVGVIVNGHWVRRFHHVLDPKFDLNITPWLRFGEENELELVNLNGPGSGHVSQISLNFYDPALYP